MAAKVGNLSNDPYSEHVEQKNLAREKKKKDTDDNSKSVWTMDLQAVHLCPKTNASSAYYKTKVQVHNMMYFNLGTKEGFCYTWDECNGNLSSEMFAYIHYIHFENYAKANPGKKTLHHLERKLLPSKQKRYCC
ncbi:hypothetical protein RRG08_001473 [Elysia crispata]|uniref:Uncharacterized protein n=1 Tax=Elysia crispata TaxID=231223 RepID=A0AAE1AZM2_9GAST|nr:hypothetical protein RRG08_001473 [Elysia crispata]